MFSFKRHISILGLLLIANAVDAQGYFPTQQFYKNAYQSWQKNKVTESVYPAIDDSYNFEESIKDSSVFYYDFFVWFFKKDWLEVNEDNAHLYINPLINLSGGKGFQSEDSSLLYRNTRGVHAYGDFNKKIYYQFALCENQSRFLAYQNAYFLDRGEYYDNDSVYNKVNAVIPAGARTKPFKINGFDYGFSFGSIRYVVSKKLTLEGGNTQLFVGNGYRSLFLSDFGIYAPYLRMNWKLSPKFSYEYIVRKNRNLFRKPHTDAVESQYEHKLFVANYLTFKASEKLSISIFSGSNQLRADSNSIHPFNWQQLSPIPILNTDILNAQNSVNGISGLNLDFAINDLKIYSQVAIDVYNNKILSACQLGMFYGNAFHIPNLQFRAEWNFVPDHFYEDPNMKKSYSHYNLPLAHVKGNNFQEIFAFVTYEYNRFYIEQAINYYATVGGTINEQIRANSIFESNHVTGEKGSTLVSNTEIGIRINKRYNPTLYAAFSHRNSVFGNEKNAISSVMFGLKVNVFNQYFDF